MQFKDALDDAADRFGLSLEAAPLAIWRLANYGGHAETTPSADGRAELTSALTLSKAAGVWIRYDADGCAEAVNLAEWRQLVPALTLFRSRTVQHDRWTAQPTGVVSEGPIHARLGAGLRTAPTSLCGHGIVVADTHELIRTLELPNTADDWCITCEQRAAGVIGA
jgi:hypothetical protein